MKDDVAGRHRAVKMNEVRGRFISALRQYTLTGTEFRIVIALNDLYNPELFKAWPSQAYLCEALGDVATRRRMPERTFRHGLRGLEKKGIVETKEVRLSREHSRLEYRIAYDKIIGRDAGYNRGRARGAVEGIQRTVVQVPASSCQSIGNPLPPYRQPLAGLPAKDCRLSSLLSSLGPSLENSLEGKNDSDFEGKEERKGTSEGEFETKAQRSLREYAARLEAQKKGKVA
jgi:hypothetical protein